MSKNERSGVLCVLAHQDDEVAMAPSIARTVASGRPVHCFFLTDGGGKGNNPDLRNAESRTVLARLGVPAENLSFLGTDLGIPDRALFRNLDRVFAGVEERTRSLDFDEIFCMAWEGGHPDHDASHLIALAVARRRGLLDNTWQYPIYNARNRRRFFRVMSPIPNGETRARRLRLGDGVRFAALGLSYPSQRLSWLGLIPGMFVQLAVLRREAASRASLDAVRLKPHEGTLLSERRYGVGDAEFRRFADEFIRRNL